MTDVCPASSIPAKPVRKQETEDVAAQELTIDTSKVNVREMARDATATCIAALKEKNGTGNGTTEEKS